MRRYSLLFGMAILASFILALVLSLSYPFQAKIAPLAVSTIGIALGVVLLLKQAFLKTGGNLQDQDEEGTQRETQTPQPTKQGLGYYLTVPAWLAVMLVMVYFLGYLISMPLFVFLYCKLHRVKWLLTSVLSLAILGLIHIFIRVMGIFLWEGLLFQ